MRPGRHGSMSSSELESIIVRNGDFLVVRRAGSGDGQAGVMNSVTGEYLGGIGGGRLPEYSLYLNPDNTGLVRGWRNILYELLSKRRIRLTRAIRTILGDHSAVQAYDYGAVTAPMGDPAPAWNHSQIRTKA